MPMRIERYELEAIQEPIVAAFAFKGRSSAKPMWNTAVQLHGAGFSAMGLSNQGVLWSDAAAYNALSHTGGNALMYLMTEFALQRAKEIEFNHPVELLHALLPEVWAYGKRVSRLPALRETFALNALVALDAAAWLLYARVNGIETFDALIPENVRPHMAARHKKIAAIPLITYSASMAEILREANAGSFFLKIKIGADPEHDGDPEKMLAWDKARLRQIHEALCDRPCSYSENNRIPYYLDANGRYDTKERLLRLLDYADAIGALERIALLEEPFPEQMKLDVRGIPVRLAADESAHSDMDVEERIALGYRAIALKPIAKTMSMTFDMIEVCAKHNIPCFCADLTVNAWMADLNKNFAARLPALPGLSVGLLESNGHQYYARWREMCEALPYPKGGWIHPRGGLYHLDADFYRLSGGIFGEYGFYRAALSEETAI